MTRAYASPILLGADGSSSLIQRAPLEPGDSDTAYDEGWLQGLVYRHPQLLPSGEIDASYARLVPVCRDLNTGPGGFLDVLHATPGGRLVLVETKLWRNPSARRNVVGKVLDLAQEFSRWSYEDLDHRVREALHDERGEAIGLHRRVSSWYPEVLEDTFHDAVARSLRRGDFMLLVVGDGIREDLARMGDFLERHSSLHFTFALVEMAVYPLPSGDRFVQPRVLAETVTLKRTTVTLESPGLMATQPDDQPEEPPDPNAQFSLDFWTEFLRELRLDDPRLEVPYPTRIGHVYFKLAGGSSAWVTAYLSRQQREIGVFLTFTRGPNGDRLYQALEADRELIEADLGIPVEWISNEGKHTVTASTRFPDLRAAIYRDSMKTWLSNRINRFVNAFGPRLERLLRTE
ncbi:MAG TPA: DUF4268 domain-containing protein [Nevskiaceae bacterium]|nr:DUF4268 domain-containing protein [Nevskiaceae bacterium]